jgi:hypothetical protein
VIFWLGEIARLGGRMFLLVSVISSPVGLGDTGRVGEIVWERRPSRYRAVLFWKSGKRLVEYIANVFVVLGNELRAVPDFHGEMEARLKMNW